MKKLFTLLAPFAIAGSLMVGISSCKDDKEEPRISIVTFVNASKTVGEGETNIEAKITLDQPASSNVILSYTLGGTAVRKIGAITGDYEVVGGVGDVEIAAGQTTASITFNILEDNLLEQEEKIVITLDESSSSTVEIGTTDQMEIIIGGGGSVVASFAETTLTVNESQSGTHDIVVNLSQAAAVDIVVEYALSPWFEGEAGIPGAAIDSLTAFENEVPRRYYDYWIDGTSGELTIPAGQTSGVIKVFVTSDLNAEYTETFSITLTESTGVDVGANEAIEVTVEQEDGISVELYWGPETGDPYTDVDMDMFLWAEDDAGELGLTNIASFNDDTEGPEILFLPDVLIPDGNYGLSYNYYAGTANPMHFTVYFAELKDGEFEAEEDIDVFEADYTLANVNPWFESGVDPLLAQTFDKSGGAYTNFSTITVPAENSRPRSGTLPKGLVRTSKMPFKPRLSK